MNKVTLRQEFLAKRKACTETEIKRRSQLIAWRFFDFLKKKHSDVTSSTLHTFLPIKRQNEIDTWIIIRCLWAEYSNVSVVVPVTDASVNTLRHYPLLPQTTLVENRWGIPEPITYHQPPLEPFDVDIVLVPLLAFDQQGQRVGYGGGFYDRFLAQCRPDCLKIGLSLFEPIEQISDIDSMDIRLDGCITPLSVFEYL